MRHVVVTGFGAISPIGSEKNTIWTNATQGISGIHGITAFDTSDCVIKYAGEVTDFELSDHYTKREIGASSRYILFARSAAKKAWEDSGLSMQDRPYKAESVGVIISSTLGGIQSLERAYTAQFQGRRISPYFISSTLSDSAACSIAIDFGAKGVCYSVSTACASSTDAIGQAYRQIATGQADMMITGGSEAVITPLVVNGFQTMRVLYEDEDIITASIPFDKRRSGFVIGEGACCLILEEEEAAKKRGARIYAEIVGYGTSCDAEDLVAPSSDGIYRAMASALSENQTPSDKVGYINAHGTSTVMNDIVESQAIVRLFSEETPMVSSTKSMTGHLLGAAGAFETGVTALALYHEELPVNVGYQEADPECAIHIVTKPTKQSLEYAISNSLGFGGHNAAIVMKHY